MSLLSRAGLSPRSSATMRKPPVIKTNVNKLKTLVHYICDRAPNPRRLGATKLNKILFFSDMEAYLTLGQPITGEIYIKHQYGPVSKHLEEILEALEGDRAIAIAHASGYHVVTGEPFTQKLFVALYRPSLDDFSAEEISIVDEMIRIICTRHTARSISDVSHNIIWESAEIGEEIPYYTAFVHTLGEITPADVDWAKGEITRRG
jgi:hypothetical protein